MKKDCDPFTSPLYIMPIIRHSEKEKHKHKMLEVVTEKVVLFGEEGAGSGYDMITSKKCECGFKEPIKVVRTKL